MSPFFVLMMSCHLTTMWLIWIMNLRLKKTKTQENAPQCEEGRDLQTINTVNTPDCSLLWIHRSSWLEFKILFYTILYYYSILGYYQPTLIILAIMAINKAKVAIGFIVAGTLTVVFGAVLLFVGPAVMNDQIIKVGCVIILVLFQNENPFKSIKFCIFLFI